MALKLLALDSEDLTIISAYSQKAILTLNDIDWDPEQARLLLAMKRLRWEEKKEGAPILSCDSVLHFDRVEKLSASGINCKDKTRSYTLLAIHFLPDRHTDIYGEIIMHFEDKTALRLTVECIEARLVDI
ncbi:DUF2948 family protein [Bartonella sp. TP]|uniref:DUF2948 family protein n=1 Tax=Bartonella sp. TP TaxID=3057550 RepID=UPI0025B25D8F|nr:DUF2948 family protein [Bartonella sp. TP]MDN5249252.1 DUF2948 family protein [Alphaproteobacteria bacterium]WJW79661.1 DUF2948 family protein [Bartonella sp. TP]